MYRFPLICAAAIVAACSRPASRGADEHTAMDTTAEVAPAAQVAPAPAATISLADVAGKWKMRITDENGGHPVEVVLNATADSSGWTLTAPKRNPEPVRVVAVAGDSIITESGPRESFILKGVQVTTRNISRLQDGKLVGMTEAHYALKGGRDSVARRSSVATRMQ
jgi:hypothetical protein